MSTRRRPPIQWLLVLSLAAAGLIASVVILVVVLTAVAPSLRRDAVDRQARDLRGQVAAIAQANRLTAPITPAKATALAEAARRETGGEVRVSYGAQGDVRHQVVLPPGTPRYLDLFTSAGDAAFTLIDSPQQLAIASRSPVYAGGDAGSLTRIGTLTVAEAVDGSSPELDQATRGAIIAAAVITLLIKLPKLRTDAAKWAKTMSGYLRTVITQPTRSLVMALGEIVTATGQVLCMALVLLAIGAPVHLAAILVIVQLAGAASNVVPIPGGLGAPEAILVAGLSSVGVRHDDAIIAALSYRILTYWAPPIPGMFALWHLHRTDAI